MKTAIHKDRFDRARNSLRDHSIMNNIDAIFAMQCEHALGAYHGGPVRAGVKLALKGIRHIVWSTYWDAVYRFSDKVGWTHIRQHPDMLPEYKARGFGERHGHHCDKLNCEDIDCISKGIPRWYRIITGMERMDRGCS
jgi:hypothetical protein